MGETMDHPRLAKLTRPQLHQAYPRDRLFKRLDQAVKHQIIWIAAPPGAGKTTLVTSYLEARALPGIWYQIDDGDADPASFFHHLGLAAQQTNPHEIKPLPPLTPEYMGGLAAYARGFFQSLGLRLDPPFTLVFDNYQNLPDESLLHGMLCEGVTQLPAGATVFFISRNGPPPAFVRLRANQNLEVIDWEELRLDHQEIRGMLHQQHAFSDQAITALHNKTGGWAAGVVLTLQAYQGDSEEVVEFDQNSPQLIFDYFAAEIFNKTSAELQEFLCRASFLPQMTVQMAEELTGNHQACRILSDLVAQQYFINQRQQPEGVQYQFHDLFREFLIAQVSARFTSPQLTQIKTQAAQILEQANRPEQAVALYMEAADWQAATQLILQQAPALITQGRNHTITNWINALPQDITQETPWLLFWRGVSRIPFSPPEARNSLERALAMFDTQQDYTGAMLSWSAIVDTYALSVVRIQPLDRWIQWLTERMEIFANLPIDIQARVASSMASALHLRQPQHPEHAAWTERALALTKQHSDLTLRVQTGFYSCFYFVYTGNLAKLEMILGEMKHWTALEAVSPAIKLLAKYGELLQHAALERLDEVIKLVAQMLELAEKTGVHLWDSLFLGMPALCAVGQGNTKVAQEYLAKLEPLRDEARPWDLSLYHLIAAWCGLLNGEPKEALEHMSKALRMTQEAGTPMIEALQHQGMMQILYMYGKHEPAVEHLAEMQYLAEQQNNPYLWFATYLCTAQMAFADPKGGTPERGYTALRQAFGLAREHDLTTRFALWLWLPTELAKLCVRALDADIEVAQVQRFIRACGLAPPIAPLDCEKWPWPLRIYTLGQFSVHHDNEPLSFKANSQHKPLELLKALVALHDRDLTARDLAQALWPELSPEAARAALDVNLHRLRKWLGNNEAVLSEAGRVRLNPHCCWVDAWAVDRVFKKIESAVQTPRDASESLTLLTKKMFDGYRGDFLSGVSASWSLLPRERLRSRFVRLTGAVGEYWERAEQWRQAVECYEQALQADPLPETFYQRLMACYQRQGLLSEACAAYERCQRVLAASSGGQPSAATQTIYQSLSPSLLKM